MKHQLLTHPLWQACIATVATLLLLSCNDKKAASPSIQTTPRDTVVSTAAETTPSATDNNESMKAPDVTPDDNGLIALSNCPTNHAHLTVSISEDATQATIVCDGEPLQTIKDDDNPLAAPGGQVPVHFMDANFDGFIDIFIGPGESRTYSTLLIWDAASKQFIRTGSLGEPPLQGFMLHPATRSLFDGGSSSAWEFDITRRQWNGQKLEAREHLTRISDPSQYDANNVSARFTIRDEQQQTTASAENAGDLPSMWPQVVQKYDME